MADHVDRMKAEHKALTIKIEALNDFIHGNNIFKTLCDLEQARMIKQAEYMEAYASILESRIFHNQKSSAE